MKIKSKNNPFQRLSEARRQKASTQKHNRREGGRGVKKNQVLSLD